MPPLPPHVTVSPSLPLLRCPSCGAPGNRYLLDWGPLDARKKEDGKWLEGNTRPTRLFLAVLARLAFLWSSLAPDSIRWEG